MITVSHDSLIKTLRSPSNHKKEGTFSEKQSQEELIILNQNIEKLSSEKRKKLLDMARLMFKEDFDS